MYLLSMVCLHHIIGFIVYTHLKSLLHNNFKMTSFANDRLLCVNFLQSLYEYNINIELSSGSHTYVTFHTWFDIIYIPGILILILYPCYVFPFQIKMVQRPATILSATSISLHQWIKQGNI